MTQDFRHSKAIKIHNGIIFGFYPALPRRHVLWYFFTPSTGGVCDKGGVKWGMVCQRKQLLGSGDRRTVYDPLSAHPRVLYGELSSDHGHLVCAGLPLLHLYTLPAEHPWALLF